MTIGVRHSVVSIGLALAITLGGGVFAANATGAVAPSPPPSPPTTATQSAIIAAAKAVTFDHTPVTAARRATIVALAHKHAVVEGGAALTGTPSIAVETGGTTIVTWSVVAPGLDPSSSLSVVLAKNGRVAGSQQVDFTRDTIGGGVIQTWTGAAFAGTKTVTASQLAQAEASALGSAAASDPTLGCATALVNVGLAVVAYGFACYFSIGVACVVLGAVLLGAIATAMIACGH